MDEQLIKRLETLRASLCRYVGNKCDCQFGFSSERPHGKRTGCPEIRRAIQGLTRLDKLEQRVKELEADPEREVQRLLDAKLAEIGYIPAISQGNSGARLIRRDGPLPKDGWENGERWLGMSSKDVIFAKIDKLLEYVSQGQSDLLIDQADSIRSDVQHMESDLEHVRSQLAIVHEEAEGWKAMHSANMGDHGCSWQECGRLREQRDALRKTLESGVRVQCWENEGGFWASSSEAETLGESGTLIFDETVEEDV